MDADDLDSSGALFDDKSPSTNSGADDSTTEFDEEVDQFLSKIPNFHDIHPFSKESKVARSTDLLHEIDASNDNILLDHQDSSVSLSFTSKSSSEDDMNEVHKFLDNKVKELGAFEVIDDSLIDHARYDSNDAIEKFSELCIEQEYHSNIEMSSDLASQHSDSLSHNVVGRNPNESELPNLMSVQLSVSNIEGLWQSSSRSIEGMKGPLDEGSTPLVKDTIAESVTNRELTKQAHESEISRHLALPVRRTYTSELASLLLTRHSTVNRENSERLLGHARSLMRKWKLVNFNSWRDSSQYKLQQLSQLALEVEGQVMSADSSLRSQLRSKLISQLTKCRSRCIREKHLFKEEVAQSGITPSLLKKYGLVYSTSSLEQFTRTRPLSPSTRGYLRDEVTMQVPPASRSAQTRLRAKVLMIRLLERHDTEMKAIIGAARSAAGKLTYVTRMYLNSIRQAVQNAVTAAEKELRLASLFNSELSPACSDSCSIESLGSQQVDRLQSLCSRVESALETSHSRSGTAMQVLRKCIQQLTLTRKVFAEEDIAAAAGIAIDSEHVVPNESSEIPQVNLNASRASNQKEPIPDKREGTEYSSLCDSNTVSSGERRACNSTANGKVKARAVDIDDHGSRNSASVSILGTALNKSTTDNTPISRDDHVNLHSHGSDSSAGKKPSCRPRPQVRPRSAPPGVSAKKQVPQNLRRMNSENHRINSLAKESKSTTRAAATIHKEPTAPVVPSSTKRRRAVRKCSECGKLMSRRGKRLPANQSSSSNSMCGDVTKCFSTEVSNCEK